MKYFVVILIMCLSISSVEAAQKIKIKGGISNNKAYVKTNIGGVKVTLKTPKLSNDSILKLINVSI